MGSTFFDRIEELKHSVGDGTLTGTVEVNQVYAAYQHNGLDLRHPRGGQALYLLSPLLDRKADYMRRLAEAVLGSNSLVNAMALIVEDLSAQVFELAPREMQDLRASGHPMVHDGHELVYDRAPFVHRLSDQELRAKNALKRLGVIPE